MRRSSKVVALRVLVASIVVLASGVGLVGSAHATFPGRNGRIAFDDLVTGQIYTINPDGSDLRQLTRIAASDFAWSPSWSPKGKRIAFTYSISGVQRIWVMNSDGSNAHQMFPDRPGYQDYTPRYTPDGKRIVFTRCPAHAGCGIYWIGVDGSGLRAITTIRPHDAFDFLPSVSSDGKRVAFSRFRAGGIAAQIYVKQLGGGPARAITPPALEGFAPDWSPGGKNLAFDSAASRLNSRMYKWRADGGAITQLTHPVFPHADQQGSYSPDGHRIAFQSDRGNDLLVWDLYRMRSDGTHITRITTGTPDPVDAAWGPYTGTASAGLAGQTRVGTTAGGSRGAVEAALARRCALMPKPFRLIQCKAVGD